MNFIEQQDYRSALSPCFGLSPTTLREARKCRIGLVSRGVDSGFAKLCGDLEKQGGLADLPGPCQKLDAARRRLLEPLKKPLPACRVVTRQL